MLEAAACRCFVITTENGGSKELISGSRYGKLIPDNRRETVEKALMENLDNREYRERAAKTRIRSWPGISHGILCQKK